jgi:adenylate kinase family enzyme
MHLSVGDYLRGISKDNEVVARYLETGDTIPGDIIIPILKSKLEQEEKEKGTKTIVLDGFPRKRDQLEMFMSLVSLEHAVVRDVAVKQHSSMAGLRIAFASFGSLKQPSPSCSPVQSRLQSVAT